MAPARVVVLGSANVDYTVAVPRLPQPGETVSEGSLLVAFGGKGANQAVAARRLGAEVRFVGCVGDDPPGREIRSALAAEGIGVEGLATAPAAATGTALIVVDAEGRNQIAVAPGANRALTVATAAPRAADLAWAQVLVCQLETPLAVVAWALEQARRGGVVTILNPAPVPAAPLPFLHLADYLTPNAGEAARLAGAAAGPDDPAAAAAALRARGAGTVIVTLGEAGALAVGPAGPLAVPAFAVPVVDTTGAGDAFNGGLAVALAEGRPLAEAVGLASAAAALACTQRGAQPSLPDRAAVERRLAGARRL